MTTGNAAMTRGSAGKTKGHARMTRGSAGTARAYLDQGGVLGYHKRRHVTISMVGAGSGRVPLPRFHPRDIRR